MGKRIWILAVILCMAIGMVASAEKNDNKFVEEFKQWEFSIGSYNYLFNAEKAYFGIGAERDIGVFLFKEEGWLYGTAGYLRGKGKTSNEFAYLGLSASAGKLLVAGIDYANENLGTGFTTPSIIKKFLALIGVCVAKNLNEIENMKKGWDYGLHLNLIKLRF